MNYFQNLKESRSSWSGTLIAALVILFASLAGIASFALYMAYARHPDLFIGLAWLTWILTQAGALVLVGNYRQRVAMLEAVIFERNLPKPTRQPYVFREEPEPFEIELEKPDKSDIEVLADLKKNENLLSLEKVDQLLSLYRASKSVTNFLLNVRKKLLREEPPQYAGYGKHPLESPSPTLDLT